MTVLVSLYCIPNLPCFSVIAGDFQSQVKVFSRITQISVSIQGIFLCRNRWKAHRVTVSLGGVCTHHSSASSSQTVLLCWTASVISIGCSRHWTPTLRPCSIFTLFRDKSRASFTTRKKAEGSEVMHAASKPFSVNMWTKGLSRRKKVPRRCQLMARCPCHPLGAREAVGEPCPSGAWPSTCWPDHLICSCRLLAGVFCNTTVHCAVTVTRYTAAYLHLHPHPANVFLAMGYSVRHLRQKCSLCPWEVHAL